MEKLMDTQSQNDLISDLAKGLQSVLRSLAGNAKELEQQAAMDLADKVSVTIAEMIVTTSLQTRQNGYASGYSDGITSRHTSHH